MPHNSYWNNPSDFVSGTLVKAADANVRFNGVTTGFDSVEAAMDMSIQVTAVDAGVVDIPDVVAVRKEKVVAFDTAGDIALITNPATEAQNWAIKTDDFVSGSDNSAKAWSIGGTGNGDPAGGAAIDWATKAEGSPVTTGPNAYSALHWSAKAQAWAAAVNLPTITAGDATDMVEVNVGGTGYDLISQGHGGGIDADTIDGSHATAFATASHNHSASQITTGTLAVARGGTGITSLGTGVAAWMGTPSSSNLKAAVTGETGSGALVFGTSPTIAGPTITGTSTVAIITASGLATFNAGLKTKTAYFSAVYNAANNNALNWTSSNKILSSPTSNKTYTFTTPSGPTNLMLKIVNGGAFTIAWPGTVEWPGGSQPGLTSSGTDILSFYYDGSTYYGAFGLAYAP